MHQSLCVDINANVLCELQITVAIQRSCHHTPADFHLDTQSHTQIKVKYVSKTWIYIRDVPDSNIQNPAGTGNHRISNELSGRNRNRISVIQWNRHN